MLETMYLKQETTAIKAFFSIVETHNWKPSGAYHLHRIVKFYME